MQFFNVCECRVEYTSEPVYRYGECVGVGGGGGGEEGRGALR